MRFITLLLLFSCLLAQPFCAYGQEEFVGPFNSWANVKTRFKARGDGSADDTKALQKALDSLSVQEKNFNTGSGAYSVIFLPRGRYRISQTLLLRGKIGINIVGEDPANTIIEWHGGDNDTLLWANGSAYFKLSRITWDARAKKSITAIGIHWTGRWNTQFSQSFASLNIEVSDCRFIGKCSYGIHGGRQGGANDSEIAIKRCVFEDCQLSAIAIDGYNALDYWIWDCRFYNCFRCVQNANGNYHLYRCYFQDTRNAVLTSSNGYYTSVRGCYSVNTDRFSYDFGKSCNPFKRIFENNYIGKTKGPSIEYYHLGRIYYNNNWFEDVTDNKQQYNLIYDSWCPGRYEVMSLSNHYQRSKPWKLDVATKNIYSINDRFGAFEKKLPAAFVNSMVSTPRVTSRKVFEVPANAGSQVIQQLINEASKLAGQKPVIHFARGTYILNRPVVIPPNADMQLIGDGLLYATTITTSKDFPGNNSLLVVKGPSSVIIRDMYLDQNAGPRSAVNGIVFENVDQPSARAFIDQLNSSARHAIVLSNTDYLYVQNENSFYSEGNKVIGGRLVQQEKGTSSLHCFGAQFAGIEVANNGRFVAKDCWYEGSRKTPIDLTGWGRVSIDGAMIAASLDSAVAIRINEFSGKVTLINMYVQGSVAVTAPNPRLDLLLWNINFYNKLNLFDFVSKQSAFRAACLGLTAQCLAVGNPGCANTVSYEPYFFNVKDQQAFMLSGLEDGRQAVPRQYTSMGKGVSNIFISRVSLGSFDQAITFKN
jgi:hypothetical protein